MSDRAKAVHGLHHSDDPDGDAIPPRRFAAAAADITRVLFVPFTVDMEGGFAQSVRFSSRSEFGRR